MSSRVGPGSHLRIPQCRRNKSSQVVGQVPTAQFLVDHAAGLGPHQGSGDMVEASSPRDANDERQPEYFLVSRGLAIRAGCEEVYIRGWLVG